MRVGVSLRTAFVTDDVRTGARWVIERARAAWEAGLDSLFVGDHHVTPVPYYQNSPLLGRLLAEWGDRPCGAHLELIAAGRQRVCGRQLDDVRASRGEIGRAHV